MTGGERSAGHGETMWAQHKVPVRGADWVIAVDLAPHGLSGDFEQLWARKLDVNLFKVCSVPFLAYGIALDDHVETTNENLVRKVVACAGHKTLRIAILKKARIDELHAVIHGWLHQRHSLHEWYSGAYVAVDLPPSEKLSREDSDWLDSLERAADVSIERIPGGGTDFP